MKLIRKYCLVGTVIIFIGILIWNDPLGLVFKKCETNPFSIHRKTNNDDSLLVPELKSLAGSISKMQRDSLSLEHYEKTKVQIKSVINSLKRLSETLEGQQLTMGNSDKPDDQEVCPEEYKGKQLNYDYPFFRKGFGRVDCKHFVPIEKLVTLLISMPKELHKPSQTYTDLAQAIAKYYGKIRVVLATEKPLETAVKNAISKLDILFENHVIHGIGQSALWNRLVGMVTTPYLLIAENITQFDDDINLERLVRLLSYHQDVLIASGSRRNLKGHWDMGCQQIVFKNWTASYQGGYYRSFNDCVICDYVSGSFMARTSTLRDIPLDENLKFGAFRDLFWRIKKVRFGKHFVSCPDVMFNIQDRDIQDEEYVGFANKHKIHKIVEANGRVRWYGCRNGFSYTSASLCERQKGIALSPASMENLADAIKFCMRACEEAGAFCEIQDGTSVGAVKLNGVLPWEMDGDIVFQSMNFSVLENLKDKFSKAGYRLAVESRPKPLANGRITGGYFALGTTNWRIEMWGYAQFESQMAVANGQVATKVLFAGQWMNFPRNPALFIRNRYGAGIYRHQQHWSHVGLKTGWKFYSPGSFTECPLPGHSACLDNYPADGNMQFRDYPN